MTTTTATARRERIAAIKASRRTTAGAAKAGFTSKVMKAAWTIFRKGGKSFAQALKAAWAAAKAPATPTWANIKEDAARELQAAKVSLDRAKRCQSETLALPGMRRMLRDLAQLEAKLPGAADKLVSVYVEAKEAPSSEREAIVAPHKGLIADCRKAVFGKAKTAVQDFCYWYERYRSMPAIPQAKVDAANRPVEEIMRELAEFACSNSEQAYIARRMQARRILGEGERRRGESEADYFDRVHG